MLKTMMLGLVLAAVALSGAMSVAISVTSAEIIPSPLQQVRDGVPTGEIVCSGDRVLMASPSGMPACAFAGSVDALERRGFVLSSEMPGNDLSSKRPEASEKAVGTGSAGASKTGDRPFVTIWQTVLSDESITIPVGNAIGTYTVDWGDGSTSDNVAGDQSHAYVEAGTYTVAITGNFERIRLNGDLDNAPKLQSIEQWGDVRWTSMESAFSGASNMIYSATDVPDLSDVTDTSCMFAGAIRFDGDLSGWDVSKVKNMSCMFAAPSSFNGRIIEIQFSSALSTVFNGDLSKWDVSSVTDMSYMFVKSGSFNGDLSGWDVSSVTDMSGMFWGASFNGDLSGWDVSSVTDMYLMFQGASFNGDLSGWDVSSVTDMYLMFQGASFNGDLSGWDVSSVTDTSYMFYDSHFNGDLSGWDVSSVTSTSNMLNGSPFNGDLSGWDVSSVTDMPGMFWDASFNGDLSGWDVSSVTDTSYMFYDSHFNGDLSDVTIQVPDYYHELVMVGPVRSDILA